MPRETLLEGHEAVHGTQILRLPLVDLSAKFRQGKIQGQIQGRSQGWADPEADPEVSQGARGQDPPTPPLFSLSPSLCLSLSLSHTLSLSLSLSLSHTHTHTHTHTGFRSPLAGAKFLFFGFRVNSHPRACPVLDLLPKFARDSAITQNLHVSHR